MVLSMLYREGRDTENLREADEPACFTDLNLDQVFADVVRQRQVYNLLPLYYTLPHNADDVRYRQEICRDLEQSEVVTCVEKFAHEMVVVRRFLELVRTLRFPYHIEGWLLEAILVYCGAVRGLADGLNELELVSQGLLRLKEYLNAYTSSAAFRELDRGSLQVKQELAAIRYNVIIKGNNVRVRLYEGEVDLSEDIEQTFAKFRQGDVRDYTTKQTLAAGMNHVGAQILEGVAKLCPDTFAHLDAFAGAHGDFIDTTIARVDRELQFFTGYLQYIGRLRRAGLVLGYPEIAVRDKELSCQDGFDLALAHQMSAADKRVVTNDWSLSGPERMLVISGPNQGGKTTFARAFGQVHYLAGLGLPVPARKARLYLTDQVLTHFEREEDMTNLRGKLYDDLLRMRQLLEQATPDSIIIMNEIFSSTALQDAILLSRSVVSQILVRDLIGVCVTFMEEVASLSEQTVSMVSTVDPEDPALRTFKIVRRRADGLAYAITIAQRHGLTRQQLRERIQL